MVNKSKAKTKPRRDRNTRRRKRIVPISGTTFGSGVKNGRTGLNRIIYLSLLALVWFFIILVPVTIYYAHDLPNISTIKQSSVRSTIMVMDRKGGLLASYGDVYGTWLDYDKIPENLIQATIATEDRRFFVHSGIDFRGLVRAFIHNISHGHMTQGGSTISQQLAKNLFLNADRTIKRKIQELLLSYWLEINFTKKEILTYYFNRVYFGSGAYGIDAAARTYFGHGAEKLSLMEAAMMAGALKGPALYSPLRDLERSYGRAGDVLDNMVEVGFIPQETADKIKKQSVKIMDKQTGGDERYFSDWVVRRAEALLGPISEPLIIYTTLMPDIQNKANKALQRVMDKEGKTRHAGQAALVSMDMDGAIKAMVGGKDYMQSQFNRVTQAHRQPGSAFKLFVFLAAFENGLKPDDVMRDSPVILNGWQPRNYTGKYRGEVTLKEAFTHSINTVAVKLSERVNRKNVVEMARRLGLTTPLVEEPSMSLGTSEVSLLELTAAYAVVAGGGYKVTPYGIVEIQNSAGQILYRHIPEPRQKLLSDDVVAVMNDLLQSVVSGGTATKAQMPFPVAGKTGTTQDYKDALFIGYGMDMVNGIWVGNDDASPMKRVTGGGIPARIWRNFMYGVYIGRDDATLITPNIKPKDKPKVR